MRNLGDLLSSTYHHRTKFRVFAFNITWEFSVGLLVPTALSICLFLLINLKSLRLIVPLSFSVFSPVCSSITTFALRLSLTCTAVLSSLSASGQSVNESIARLGHAASESQFNTAFDSMIYFLHAGKLDFHKEDVRTVIDIVRQKPFGDRVLPKVYGWASGMVGNGRLDEALTFFLESAEFYKSRGKSFGEALSYFEIALIHHKAADYDKANEYYERTLHIGGDSLHHRTQIGCYNGSALILRHQKKYARAASEFRRAYQVARTHADTAWVAILMGNIGSCHLAEGSYDSSLYYYHRNLLLIRNTSEFENEIETYVNLGSVYAKKGLLTTAESYVDSAVSIIKERNIFFNDFFGPMDQIYRTYADIYVARGDYRQAYEYQAKFHEAVQKKQGELNGRNLKQLEALHDYEQSQREVGLLREINEGNQLVIGQQRYIASSLAVIVLLLMAVTLIVLRNSRERKRLNLELIKSNAELARLNSVKNTLLSVISHDLRTPIANLRGTLNLVRDGQLSKDEVSVIYEAIDRRLKLSADALENLLRWGKTQLVSQATTPSNVLVASLVDQVVDQLGMDIRRKDIEVMNYLSRALTCWVDRDQLEVILRNIISNAVKFTPGRGLIEIDGRIEGDSLKVSVKDSGVGMSSEQISNLFTPGGNNSTRGTNREPGTGIGLLLTKEMVVANKGDIRVESEPGKGSTFLITFRWVGLFRPAV